MKREIQVLFEIIKYYLNENNGDTIKAETLNWEELISFANRHNVLSFIYYYVEELGIQEQMPSELYQRLFQTSMYGITKSFNQIHAAEELSETFEKQGIYTAPVKGICAKYYYPKYEMRSMGDIDILYKPEQQQKLKDVMKRLGYVQTEEGRKHDCYFREPFVAVEMHRELVAADSKYSVYYKQIWDRLKQKENHQFIYEMSLEDEYIYSLIHLGEHFQNGGIGIRFLMDVYIYNKMEHMDWEYVEKELKRLELWEFYKNISALAETWFGEKKIQKEIDEEVIEQLAEFILSNGVFGTQRNAAAIAVAKEGKEAFLIKAIFPNLKNMISMFPWLEKWPILLPYAWCLRGVKSILYRPKNIKTQINRYKHGDAEYGEKLKQFYKMCGL